MQPINSIFNYFYTDNEETEKVSDSPRVKKIKEEVKKIWSDTMTDAKGINQLPEKI